MVRTHCDEVSPRVCTGELYRRTRHVGLILSEFHRFRDDPVRRQNLSSTFQLLNTIS